MSSGQRRHPPPSLPGRLCDVVVRRAELQVAADRRLPAGRRGDVDVEERLRQLRRLGDAVARIRDEFAQRILAPPRGPRRQTPSTASARTPARIDGVTAVRPTAAGSTAPISTTARAAGSTAPIGMTARAAGSPSSTTRASTRPGVCEHGVGVRICGHGGIAGPPPPALGAGRAEIRRGDRVTRPGTDAFGRSDETCPSFGGAWRCALRHGSFADRGRWVECAR